MQAPGHGKEEVNGLQGVEKTYAYSVFAQLGQLAEISNSKDKNIKATMH
jgi:hypothetical protein